MIISLAMAINDIDGEGPGPDQIGGLQVRSEEIGFAPDAMLLCKRCDRPNPPTRTECLYCGGEIEGSTAEPQLELRELESWENGFNVVVIGADRDSFEMAVARAAALLTADPESIQAIISSGKSLPVARVESEDKAATIVEKLWAEGIRCRVVTDESLSPASVPVRLRSIRFGDTEIELTHFGRPQVEVLNAEDLALIVQGLLLQGKTESIEKRKRRSTETLSETQTSSDEPVIDVYSRNDPTGWRIPVAGFDFSCLGRHKSLLAGHNIDQLIEKLAAFAPHAKVVRDYGSVHSMLEHAWPGESRRDSLGMRRTGFARRSSSTIFTTNNLLQLTKYSRLQWHLL